MSALYSLDDCKKVLKGTKAHQQAFPFAQPVDWKALQIPDYPKIIKKPMDFGTIGKKLDGKKYASSKEFIEDMELVFNNAKTYNIQGSDIYIMTENVEAEFRKQLAKIPVIGHDSSSKSSTHEVRSFNETELKELGRGIANLNSKQLETVVKLIHKHQPSLIKDTTTEIELDVRELSNEFLTELYHHVKSCGKKKKRSSNRGDGQPPAKKRKLSATDE